MRYVIARKEIYKVKKSVLKHLKYEDLKKINSIKGCFNFKKKIVKNQKRN